MTPGCLLYYRSINSELKFNFLKNYQIIKNFKNLKKNSNFFEISNFGMGMVLDCPKTANWQNRPYRARKHTDMTPGCLLYHRSINLKLKFHLFWKIKNFQNFKNFWKFQKISKFRILDWGWPWTARRGENWQNRPTEPENTQKWLWGYSIPLC